jgi:voltage-gated potassium channel
MSARSELTAKMPSETFWRQLESGRVEHRLEPLVLAATLLLIPVLVTEADASSHGWREAAQLANWGIWAVFLADLVLVLSVARRRKAALRAHMLDFTVVVLTVPVVGSVLSSFRLLRLTRLLRLLRLGTILLRAVQRERRFTSGAALRFAALLTTVLVVLSGAIQSVVDDSDFHSTWDGIWWAAATVTTVGYGDIVPHTVAGRIVAIMLMFTGIGFLSVLTAAIASRFVQVDSGTEDVRAALARIEAELAELKESPTPLLDHLPARVVSARTRPG